MEGFIGKKMRLNNQIYLCSEYYNFRIIMLPWRHQQQRQQ